MDAELERIRLSIDMVEATCATQVRVKLSADLIDEYTEDIKAGADMPAVDVFAEKNSDRYVLADGFHRHRAFINAGHETLPCLIHEGTLHDALVFALGANQEHGLRRSPADKRHAIQMVLKDPELSQLTRQEQADICGVHKRSVQKIANVKDTVEEEPEEHEGGEAREATDDDVRDNGTPEPTQEQVDLDNLRSYVRGINTMQYSGITADEKLEATTEDIADFELASSWLADYVITHRNRGE